MNKKEKNKHLPSGRTQEEPSVSSAPVDCYVPESTELASLTRVKQNFGGGV